MRYQLRPSRHQIQVNVDCEYHPSFLASLTLQYRCFINQPVKLLTKLMRLISVRTLRCVGTRVISFPACPPPLCALAPQASDIPSTFSHCYTPLLYSLSPVRTYVRSFVFPPALTIRHRRQLDFIPRPGLNLSIIFAGQLALRASNPKTN